MPRWSETKLEALPRGCAQDKGLCAVGEEAPGRTHSPSALTTMVVPPAPSIIGLYLISLLGELPPESIVRVY